MNYSLKNDKLTVTVSDRGAELQSILGADGTEYLWQGDPKYWADRAINLFPYVARPTEGRYYLDGQEYPMPAHGFAPYWPFVMVQHSENKLVFRMESNGETRKMYPREFVFDIEYVLVDDRLEVTFRIVNRDEKTMYFGLGGHPGINVPLVPGIPFEKYRLRFSEACEPELALLSEKRFLTGEYAPYPLENGTDIPLQHTLFDNDAIVLRRMAPQVTLETDGDSHSVTVGFPQMPYLGFWHAPLTDAPYVCIEPWASLPSVQDRITVLEEQEDLIRLEAGAVYTNNWYLSVS